MRDIIMGLTPMPTEERVTLCTETAKINMSVEQRSKSKSTKKNQVVNPLSKTEVRKVKDRTYAEVVSRK